VTRLLVPRDAGVGLLGPDGRSARALPAHLVRAMRGICAAFGFPSQSGDEDVNELGLTAAQQQHLQVMRPRVRTRLRALLRKTMRRQAHTDLTRLEAAKEKRARRAATRTTHTSATP
jgi:hypothetical protein